MESCDSCVFGYFYECNDSGESGEICVYGEYGDTNDSGEFWGFL